ncbi:hypothetical protein [Moellerella wisconsensis]|uniref:hypothetical protein n=1 Tax=Moellerella wisconsensis TaxID=158849 RepID=UPI000640DD3C|nr:hypothetical protein [Moellerella wisconsensis]KLN95593.1 hypothetical protein VK86_14510 [Moellerella wisconsensis]
MAESKKTTTVSFRIEDDLKEKLLRIAERENKTLTNKARELLAEALNLSPRKTLTENLQDEVNRLDRDLRLNLAKWNMEVSRQLSTFNANRSLINDLSEESQRLRQELNDETKQHQKTQRKITQWTMVFFLTVLLSNALVIALLIFLR